MPKNYLKKGVIFCINEINFADPLSHTYRELTFVSIPQSFVSNCSCNDVHKRYKLTLDMHYIIRTMKKFLKIKIDMYTSTLHRIP